MISSDNQRPYDFMVFGASGFSGQYVVEELASVSGSEGVEWAVAGRDQSKLNKVLNEVSSKTGKNWTNIRTVKADVKDFQSLLNMCHMTKVLLNCVGPYRFGGERIVRACIETKTHYVDICGEPFFLEKIQLLYHEAAKEAKCYVIGSCGYDCLPSEIGMQYVEENFDGDLEAVEVFMKPHMEQKPLHINYATWQSAVHGFAEADEIKPIRKKLMPDRLPTKKDLLPKRKLFDHCKDVQGYCLTYKGADKSVLVRTQHYLYKTIQKNPVTTEVYLVLHDWFEIFRNITVGIMLLLLTKCSWGLFLLETFPSFFTLGLVGHLDKSKVENPTFSFYFNAYGYKKGTENQRKKQDSIKMSVKLTSSEDAYVITATSMVQSALVILKERNQLPDEGGVYTAGSAFYHTHIRNRMCDRGIHLAVIDDTSKSKL